MGWCRALELMYRRRQGLAAQAAARATCVVGHTTFGRRAHCGVACGAPAPHFLCGHVGGAGCLGRHVLARAHALRETDTLARPAPPLPPPPRCQEALAQPGFF